jgi:hypothetical protein
VWSLVAAACFVPSLVISWRALLKHAPSPAVRPVVPAKTARAAA